MSSRAAVKVFVNFVCGRQYRGSTLRRSLAKLWFQFDGLVFAPGKILRSSNHNRRCKLDDALVAVTREPTLFDKPVIFTPMSEGQGEWTATPLPAQSGLQN